MPTPFERKRKIRSDKGVKRGANRRTNGLWIKVIAGMKAFLQSPFKKRGE